MQKRLEILLSWLDRLFGAAACLALVGIVGVVLLQIVARYALPKSPVWTEEVSRYLFAYVIVLASGSVITRKRHVRLEIFHHRLSKRTASLYAAFCHLLVVIFAAWLLPHAWDYMMVGQRQTSPALGIRMSWVFASALVFFGLVCLFSLLSAVREWLIFKSGGKT